MKYKFNFFYLTFLLALGACNKKSDFSAVTIDESTSSSALRTYSVDECANFTQHKADFLFLIDNSSSRNFLDYETKQSIEHIVATAASNSDYHVYVAPLVDDGNPNLTQYPLLINDPSSLNSNFSYNLHNEIPSLMTFNEQAGSQEDGLQRAHDVISANMNNNIFRQGSAHFVIIVSDGDANALYQTTPSGNIVGNDYYNRYTQLLNLKNNLNSSVFRFITVGAGSNNCGGSRPNYREATFYKKASRDFYALSSSTDQAGRTHPDFYDLCTLEHKTMFDDFATTFEKLRKAHTYNRWKIADYAPTFPYNPAAVKIWKSTPSGNQLLDSTEWAFYNNMVAVAPPGVNTRTHIDGILNPGEKQDGFLIEMYGDGIVTYPECILIQSKPFPDYFGYIVIAREPDLNSLRVRVDGVEYSRYDGGGQGWQYIGYQDDQNIKVVSESDFTPATPAIERSGYVIRIYPAYTNDTSISVTYKPGTP